MLAGRQAGRQVQQGEGIETKQGGGGGGGGTVHGGDDDGLEHVHLEGQLRLPVASSSAYFSYQYFIDQYFFDPVMSIFFIIDTFYYHYHC